MMLDPADTYEDYGALRRSAFDRDLANKIRIKVTPTLVEEYRSNPHGVQSDDLMRVLNYFRKADIRGKYAILFDRARDRYRIYVLTGSRLDIPKPLDKRLFETEDEADFAVFEQRVADLMRGTK